MRLAFDHYGVPYTYFASPRLRDGNLRAKYDVIVFPHAGQGGSALINSVRAVQEAQTPGRIAWKEPVTDPPYKRISFFCRGAEIFVINEIQKVY